MHRMNSAKEKELLRGAKSLEQDALAEIYDTYSPGIFRYTMRLTGDENTAEDCVADTFAKFLHALQNHGGPTDHLQAYLYRIAHNWITDRYRDPLPPETSLTEELSENKPEILQIVQENLERQRVRQSLFQLTTEQRQVISLKYLEGWDNADIAAAMQKPIGAVKALQHRALQTLRNILGFTEDADEENR